MQKIKSIQKGAGEEETSINAAEITKDIAINFLRYFQQTAELGFYSTGENVGKTHEEVFEEFIKTL